MNLILYTYTRVATQTLLDHMHVYISISELVCVYWLRYTTRAGIHTFIFINRFDVYLILGRY